MAAPIGQTNCRPSTSKGCLATYGSGVVPYRGTEGETWCCDQYAGAPGYQPPVQIEVRPTGSTSLLSIRGNTYEDALAKYQALLRTNSEFANVSQRILAQYEANKPRELFPGAVALAGVVASAGVGLAGAPAYVSATLSQLAEQVERSQNNMSLNISGLLGGIGQALGGINTSAYGNISQILGAGATIAGAALAPSPSYVSGPVYGAMPTYPSQAPVVQTAAGSVPVFAAAGAAASALARVVQPILFKIATKLGLRRMPSLQTAMNMIRKMAKLLASPEAVAVALGITTAELATLITANSAKKRRRMNPANSKALRRAARRIKSFHRLCVHTDVLKSRGRRSGGRSCGTCRKSPCRC